MKMNFKFHKINKSLIIQKNTQMISMIYSKTNKIMKKLLKIKKLDSKKNTKSVKI